MSLSLPRVTSMNAGPASSRERLAAALLILFAFAAWNLTALANIALALLALLFLMDVPRHWRRLGRDPAVWLLLVGILLTTLLAWRAAVLMPQMAAQQWDALTHWLRPLLFILVAWWLRADPTLIRKVLLAAVLGLLMGVVRGVGEQDLAALRDLFAPARVEGFPARADFGYAALALGFLSSIVLLGLFSFRREILAMRLPGRFGSGLGPLSWGAAMLVFLIILLVIQARGAALALALVALLMLVRHLQSVRSTGMRGVQRTGALLIAGTLVLAMLGAVLWTSAERIESDLAALTLAEQPGHYSYESSIGTRLNLYRIGAALIAQRPLLGWGPGSSATQDLIPAGVIAVSEHDRINLPNWAHLHSVPIEILVRFGLPGLLFAALFILVMARGYRVLRARDAVLARFMLLGSILALLFCLYDFRLVRLDLGLFCVLFCGILYSFSMHDGGVAKAHRDSVS
ncbi:MAG: O-antigen ligase domain-containing protein [Sphingobacteriia bacterium]|nr:O-antigen ligase domain-containing protein [Sphingobacteriia bacterium]NCC40720.1 O-antigen ligase domain-containing protein [Gammaproteobacteria bacterium]